MKQKGLGEEKTTVYQIWYNETSPATAVKER
jgi:hypothetical protein